MAIGVFFSLNINYRKLSINLPQIQTTMKATKLFLALAAGDVNFALLVK